MYDVSEAIKHLLCEKENDIAQSVLLGMILNFDYGTLITRIKDKKDISKISRAVLAITASNPPGAHRWFAVLSKCFSSGREVLNCTPESILGIVWGVFDSICYLHSYDDALYATSATWAKDRETAYLNAQDLIWAILESQNPAIEKADHSLIRGELSSLIARWSNFANWVNKEGEPMAVEILNEVASYPANKKPETGLAKFIISKISTSLFGRLEYSAQADLILKHFAAKSDK